MGENKQTSKLKSLWFLALSLALFSFWTGAARAETPANTAFVLMCQTLEEPVAYPKICTGPLKDPVNTNHRSPCWFPGVKAIAGCIEYGVNIVDHETTVNFRTPWGELKAEDNKYYDSPTGQQVFNRDTGFPDFVVCEKDDQGVCIPHLSDPPDLIISSDADVVPGQGTGIFKGVYRSVSKLIMKLEPPFTEFGPTPQCVMGFNAFQKK